MRLVYLDNSNLNELEKALRDRPEEFSDFVRHWIDSQSTLAFSSVNVWEIGRSDFRDARERRYEVVRALTPIRTNIPITGSTALEHAPLLTRELIMEIWRATENTASECATDRYWTGFPSKAERGSITIASMTAELKIVRGLTGMFHECQKLAASAEYRPKGATRERLRLRDLSDHAPTERQMQNGLSEFQKALEEIPAPKGMESGPAAKAYQEALAQQVATMKNHVAQSMAKGQRRAFAERLGCDYEKSQNEYLDVLIADSVLRGEMVTCAQKFCDISDGEILDNLKSRIKLKNCPGTWVSHTVEQEVYLSEEKPPVSNKYDLAHLSHLPYVDLFLSDKRIANYVRQVHDREPELNVWTSCPPPISIPASLDAIIETVTCDAPKW